MAEMLIYKGPHWMDKLTEADIAKRIKLDTDFQAKYDSRYVPGDIVEVRETGAVITNNERTKFTIVSVPAKKKADLLHMQEPDIDVLSLSKVWKRMRKYKLDEKLLSVADQASFVSGDVELTDAKLSVVTVDKSA